MSHFSVLVVTKDKTESALEAALQPFHEFECTGTFDQYVVEVDKTEEARKLYETDTTTRLQDSSGVLHDPYDAQFYRDPTPEEISKHGAFIGTGTTGGLFYTSRDWGDGRGYRGKIQFVPEGMTEIPIPKSQVTTFAQFCEGWYGHTVCTQAELDADKALAEDDRKLKYGYTLVDDAGEVIKTIDITNPNKKWDWWVIGGRWKGMLKVKTRENAIVGSPGLMGSRYSADATAVDACLKRDLDLDTMRNLAIERRKSAVIHAYDGVKQAMGEKYGRQLHEIRDSEITKLWNEFRSLIIDMKAKWEADNRPGRLWDHMRQQSERLVELESLKLLHIGTWDMFDSADVPEEEANPFAWAEKALALSTRAFLGADGVWRERGEMGWFGMSHGDKAEGEWEAEYAKALDEVPDDHMIWVVDCHI